nr:MAG TPA: hypothetical protein [Caudoviricetes sp.]
MFLNIQEHFRTSTENFENPVKSMVSSTFHNKIKGFQSLIIFNCLLNFL